MSVLRIMLFMLSAKIKNILQGFKLRVAGDQGVFEAESCLETQLNTLNNQNLLDSAKLIITPNAYKQGKLYSIIPSNGSGDMTFSRATSATRVNAQRLIETVGLNIPRIDYLNGSCPSILVEPQRTNIATFSANFANSNWSKNEVSVISNAIMSPDGSINASKIVESNANSIHRVLRFIGSATPRTASIFAKAGERSKFIFYIGPYAYTFDLINGTAEGFVNPAGAVPTIENYGNGWYRCSLTTDLNANNTFAINLTTDIAAASYQGDGVSGLYIWGAQREDALNLTSYIPTTNSEVTRNADVITKSALTGITTITENFENGTTNLISGSPSNYTMSQGLIKNVIAT
ncbi:MAG: hypothetical protein K2Y30_01885 [Flavobacteriaceae bacterium]|nr:hypothetical protein [Flavobacteriaceae bacterium]